MVKQEAPIQGIRMSRGVELVLVTRQEIVILPKVEPIVAQGVFVVVRVRRYTKPILDQQSGNIVRRVSMDWSKRIHSVNKVSRCMYVIRLDITSMNFHLLKIM